MGRTKKADAEQASREGDSETAGTVAAAAAVTRHCCLCKQSVSESEDHILGACTHCKQPAFHFECATEHVERLLKLEAKLGGHTNKGLKAVLLVTKDRPQDLLASNGRPQKWKLLRPCPACQEGTLEAADVVKAHKARPSLPVVAPAPRPPRVPAPKQAASGKQAAAANAAQLSYSKPTQQPYEAPGRVADRMRSSSSTGSFAAEQERLAKESRAEEQQLKRQAAAQRRAAATAEQQAGTDSQAQAQAPTGGDHAAPHGSGAESDTMYAAGVRPGSAAGGAGPLGASTPHGTAQLSRQAGSGGDSRGGGSTVSYCDDGGPPGGTLWPQEYDTTGYSLAGATGYSPAAREVPVGHQIDGSAGLPAWLSDSPAAAATPQPAEHWPADAWPASPAVEWLPPQFEGREEAPEEVIDELMAMLMGSGAG